MKADTWLALVNGELSWSAALGDGLINASGARADLSHLLPFEKGMTP
jgi:hypothetical protein